MSERPTRRQREIPFADHLGLDIKERHAEGAIVEAVLGDHLFQGSGRVHGGYYCVIVEMAASAAATDWLQTDGAVRYYPDEDPETLVPFGVSNTTDFLRPASTGTLRGVSSPVHRGRRMQLWAVEVRQVETDAVVATGNLRLINTVRE